MPHVFLSYSHSDLKQARELAKAIESRGLEVWMDLSHIAPATSWSSEIAGAIEGCSAFILLLSEKSANSKHVEREVTLAFELDKKIVPAMVEECELPLSLKYQLSGVQHIEWDEFDRIFAILTQAPLPKRSSSKSKNRRIRKQVAVLAFVICAAIAGVLVFQKAAQPSRSPDGLSSNTEVNDLYKHAVELESQLDRKNIENAIQLLQKAVAIDSHFTKGYVRLADYYAELYRFFHPHDSLLQAAYGYALRAMESDRKDPEAYVALSATTAARADYPAAIMAGKKAIELAPKSAPAHVNLANVYRLAGNYLASIETYRKAYELDSNDRWTTTNLIFSFTAAGDTVRATALMPRAGVLWQSYYDKHPEDQHAHVMSILWSKQEFPQKLAQLIKMTSDPSINPFTLLLLTNVFAYFRMDDVALGCLRQAVSRGLQADLRDQPLFRNISTRPEFAEIRAMQKKLGAASN